MNRRVLGAAAILLIAGCGTTEDEAGQGSAEQGSGTVVSALDQGSSTGVPGYLRENLSRLAGSPASDARLLVDNSVGRVAAIPKKGGGLCLAMRLTGDAGDAPKCFGQEQLAEGAAYAQLHCLLDRPAASTAAGGVVVDGVETVALLAGGAVVAETEVTNNAFLVVSDDGADTFAAEMPSTAWSPRSPVESR